MKTYTSFDQFCRVTGIIRLEVLCERLRSGSHFSRGSRHLDLDVLIMRLSVCLRLGSKELYNSQI